jgi:hypothetical protein
MKFDSKMDMGNVLTAVSLVLGGAGAGVAAYNALDKRVTVLETERINAQAMASERALNTQAALNEIKADIRELTRELKEQRK